MPGYLIGREFFTRGNNDVQLNVFKGDGSTVFYLCVYTGFINNSSVSISALFY